MKRSGLAIAALIALGPASLHAQDSTSTVLSPVVVQVGRDAGRSVLDLPYAITSVMPDSVRPGQRHTSLDEALFLVPGVVVFNRNNPAQDPRVSIRGFGARSAFGIRGIRVMRDGIPLTLPDGQTPVDYLDLENVGRVEVLRGSASSLYGNAGGGVIDIRSSEPGDSPLFASAKAWNGTNASRKVVAQTAGRLSRLSYQTTASRWTTDGFRAYSKQHTTTADVRAHYTLGPADYKISIEGFEMPLAESPGALTLAQLKSHPDMADSLSVRKQAGKIVKHAQFGVVATRGIHGGDLLAAVHAGRRALYNPLTFGIVHLRRHTSGAEVRGTLPWKIGRLENRATAGLELQRQGDDRSNFTNCTDLITPLTKATATCPRVGGGEGTLTLDQRELVSSTGIYVGDELNLSARYLVTASARADAVHFAVRDRLISTTNPDDSGDRRLNSISPMAGFTVRVSPAASYYWNVSSAFETPTATELGNHPDGSAGINQQLKPQKSLTYETGYKGITRGGLQYSSAIFRTGVRDELVPFEIPSSSGRRYFRNAGRTTRRGAELSGGKRIGIVDIGLAYTLGDFKYKSFTVSGVSYAGKRIPGVPRQSLQAGATVHLPAAALVAEWAVSDRVFVDDANSLSAGGYGTLNLRFVADQITGAGGISFTAGAYNLFDRRYVSSVVVNAAAGKFFEPGQRRSVFAGFNLSFAPKSAK